MTALRLRCSSRASSALLGLGLGLALALVVAGAFPNSAQAAGCQATQIAVVVSFNELGGGTRTACIKDVDTGFAALEAAGYSFTPVAGQPFVCRINDLPASDQCQRIPPATAYWGYWTAPMGGSWSYSAVGAGSVDPEPGGVQGWSFGADAEPAIAPPAAVGADTTDAEGTASARPATPGTQPAASEPARGPPWGVLATIAGGAVLGGAAYRQSRRRRSGPMATGTGPPQ